MAFGTGDLGPPAFSVGVDVMKLKIPPRTTFTEFVDIVDSQVKRPCFVSSGCAHSLALSPKAHDSREEFNSR
jgi:hypothetical protein